jgi:hypothetical protein
MSTTGAPGTRASVRKYAPGELRYEEERGTGWVLFAGMMLATLGILNLIDGIAAVSRSKFFVAGAEFVFGDLRTWGWILIVIAVVQGVTALGVFLNWKAVRWVGAAIAGVNAIAQLMFLPAYPLWALSLFTLDILVIYGLLAYAGPRE